MTLNKQIDEKEGDNGFFYSLLNNRGSDPCNTTMLICGDLFINTTTTYDNWKNITNKFNQDIISLIQNADVSLVNLEAPATLSSNKILKSGPALQMKPHILSTISQIGFNGVTLANNHIMDFGAEGLMDTLSGANGFGLLTCGAGANIHEAIQPIIIQRSDGLKIFVFSFCEKEFGISDNNSPGSAWISHPLVLSQIDKCRPSADFIIVIAHGGLEYLPLPPPERQALFHQFIDAGADMIVGHHPHVPQGWEKYKGKYIFFSTGNFIFDKLGGAHRPETEWGFMVQLHFDSKKIVDIKLILTENKEGQVKLIEDESLLEKRILYLNALSDIVQHPELYCQYWQEMVIRLYYDQYIYLFARHIFIHHFITVLNIIRRYLRRNPTYPNLMIGTKEINTYDLVLLNLIRNESHHWAIRRALSIITMQEPDLRCNQTKYRVDQLFKLAKGEIKGIKSIKFALSEVIDG